MRGLYSHIWLCHDVTTNLTKKTMRKKGLKTVKKNVTHPTVIYPYIPAIPQYRYTVCRGVPKSTTVPVPTLPILENPRVFLYPCLTLTMLGVINQMLWHKEGYQIASVGTHVYSPSGYNVQFEGFVLSPSQFPLSTQPFISPGLSREHLARQSSMMKCTLLLEIGEGWERVGEYVM